ncbi:MAG: WD40 repeat domain-containing protein [Rhodospirillaceae bacterium]|jgi:hypothetical protein|nr:WD40 repeat domain-containing protein [Rhodospirillaceae bacterium]
MKILCATHSSRPFMEARCQLNALEQRFADRELINLPPLESFPSVEKAVPHTGSLTLWEIVETGFLTTLRHLATYDPGHKIQSAAFLGDKLVVYGSDRLEVLAPGFEIIRTISDPWLVGGHTVFPCSDNEVWVTCAPANAVMKVNIVTGNIIKRIVLPEQFGCGYVLDPECNLHDHCIPTDYQPTHVNCAVPKGDDLLLTMWIQGSLGILKPNGTYHEIISGYRGAHGGNWHPYRENIVTLADSPTGIVCFFNSETGELIHRIDTSSKWLHDAQIIAPGIIATSHGDDNIIRLHDENSGEVLAEYDVEPFGKSAMFVNAYEAGSSWRNFLSQRTTENTLIESERPELHLDENVIITSLTYSHFKDSNDEAFTSLRFRSKIPLRMETIIVLDTIKLFPGNYIFEAQAEPFKGSVSIGMLDMTKKNWHSVLIFDSARKAGQEIVHIPKRSTFQIVVAACNQNRAALIDVELIGLSLRKINRDKNSHTFIVSIMNSFKVRYPLLSSFFLNTRYKR